MWRFEISHYDRGVPTARVATLTTRRGPVETPAFMPVGTRGTVKTATGRDVWMTGARMVLANTYHLMLRPGPETVAALGGVHALSGFEGPMLTDSGGYQAMSLDARLDDDGMTFRSTYDGSTVRLTPEECMRVQSLLGAEVAVALDDCPRLPADPGRIEAACRRTSAWARRCREVHPGAPAGQALFGIVQGGLDAEARARSAADIVPLGFDGICIGGLSVGETAEETASTLRALEPHLPLDQPRYLMGVADPVRIVDGVAAGIDLFDSVWPTRMARHGHALLAGGKLSMKGAAGARSTAPIDPECPCEACRTLSRGTLRHLFSVNEPVAGRLITLHNLTFMGRLMARLRTAIRDGRLTEVGAEVKASWAPSQKG